MAPGYVASVTEFEAHAWRAGYELVDPAAVGVDVTRLDDLLDRARREIDDGLLPSCQMAVARGGRLVASETFGDADPASRYVVFSCTKGVVAGAVWLLMGEGKLDPGQRVAEIVPEFGTNGKDAVTVEQLLVHTAGFPHAPLDVRRDHSRQRRLERFAQWYLEWEPGTRYEYHPTSAHWVLAEVIERLAGQDYRKFIHDRILEPLGLRSLRLGEPSEHQDDVNALVEVGEPPTADEIEAAIGVPGIDLADLEGEITQEALLAFDEPGVRALGVPGAGAISTAADLALYYQALLHDEHGLWDPELLEDATTTVRCELPDPVLPVRSCRSLGLMLAGDEETARLRGFGYGMSPRTFGHDGAGGQIAWADPDSGLSFCYLTNGLDAHRIREARRKVGLSSRAAACTSS
jgi:CubicO group peptidase (beta-lactamase class C family)